MRKLRKILGVFLLSLIFTASACAAKSAPIPASENVDLTSTQCSCEDLSPALMQKYILVGFQLMMDSTRAAMWCEENDFIHEVPVPDKLDLLEPIACSCSDIPKDQLVDYIFVSKEYFRKLTESLLYCQAAIDYFQENPDPESDVRWEVQKR